MKRIVPGIVAAALALTALACGKSEEQQRAEAIQKSVEQAQQKAEDKAQKPWRFHLRAPSFVNLAAIEELSIGYMIADMIAILGSVDIVLGDVDR